MASSARNAGNGSGTENLSMPSRNPLPLSATQESQVREVFNARVRSACADEIKGEQPKHIPVCQLSCSSAPSPSVPRDYSPDERRALRHPLFLLLLLFMFLLLADTAF